VAQPSNTARRLTDKEQRKLRWGVDEIRAERTAPDSRDWRRQQYLALRDKLHDLTVQAHAIHATAIAENLRTARDIIAHIIDHEDY